MVESLIDELSSTYFSSHSLEGMLTSFSQEPNDYRNIMSIFATSSILDLDDIVTSIIHITAICQREWDSVRLSTNSAKKKRTIHELDSQCYHCTRFNPEEQLLEAWNFVQEGHLEYCNHNTCDRVSCFVVVRVPKIRSRGTVNFWYSCFLEFLDIARLTEYCLHIEHIAVNTPFTL